MRVGTTGPSAWFVGRRLVEPLAPETAEDWDRLTASSSAGRSKPARAQRIELVDDTAA